MGLLAFQNVIGFVEQAGVFACAHHSCEKPEQNDATDSAQSCPDCAEGHVAFAALPERMAGLRHPAHERFAFGLRVSAPEGPAREIEIPPQLS